MERGELVLRRSLMSPFEDVASSERCTRFWGVAGEAAMRQWSESAILSYPNWTLFEYDARGTKRDRVVV